MKLMLVTSLHSIRTLRRTKDIDVLKWSLRIMVLQTGRKVYPFLEKGAWFPGVRATLSWTRPPGHFDKERCILNASTKVRHFPEPLAGYGGIEHGKAAWGKPNDLRKEFWADDSRLSEAPFLHPTYYLLSRREKYVWGLKGFTSAVFTERWISMDQGTLWHIYE